MDIFYHEELQRGGGQEKLKAARVTVCGAGALGANIAETLARSGVGNIKVVDDDRVEERNLSTQPYSTRDVGSGKAQVLCTNIYYASRCRAEAANLRLTPENAHKLLKDADLVIDTFDNSRSREAVAAGALAAKVACLHAGMSAGYSEVIWEPGYKVPSDVNDDVCDYPLARTLAVITAAIASESAIRFIMEGETQSYTFTFRDMRVQRI